MVIHERTSLSRLSSSTSTCSSQSAFLSTSCTPSWARQPDRHGKLVLLRQQGEWRRLRRHHLPHRLWAQLHGLRRAQRLFRFFLLHYPVIGPGHGWRDTRQAAHRGTPRRSRLLRTSQSVSRRHLLCSMDQGTWWRKKCRSISWFWGHEKHVQCSQQVFWKHPNWKVVDGSGKLDEGDSSSAQIRTLLEEQKQMIIAECRNEVGHHELQAAHAKEERRFLREELWRQKLEFPEVHHKVLQREELRKFQSSTFDTIARRKLIEDQNTILELSGRVQELQNKANCMNDSKDFQDAESVRSGHSHVASRPVHLIRYLKGCWGLHSYRRAAKKGRQAFGTHGISGNVFANPPACSSDPYPQELESLSSLIEEPLHSSTAEKSESPEQNQDLRCQSGPSAKDSIIFSGGDFSKNYGADQQRRQISDLHFDKFRTPATFACWKVRFKTEVCTCSQFPQEAMQWIKEVELVDSVDELRSSSSTRGISMPNFEVLDARIASALNKIIHNSHFKKEDQSGGTKKTRKRTVSFEVDRLPTWSTNNSGSLVPIVLSKTTPTCSLLFIEMTIFRNSIQSGDGILLSLTKIPHDDNLEG